MVKIEQCTPPEVGEGNKTIDSLTEKLNEVINAVNVTTVDLSTQRGPRREITERECLNHIEMMAKRLHEGPLTALNKLDPCELVAAIVTAAVNLQTAIVEYKTSIPE